MGLPRETAILTPGLRTSDTTQGGVGFSNTGARALFSVPGTGLIWSKASNKGTVPQRHNPFPEYPEDAIRTVADLEATQKDPKYSIVSSRTGRRLSPRQLESLHKKLTDMERTLKSLEELEKFSNALRDQINCWQDMPSVIPFENYKVALQPQIFSYAVPEPPPPHYKSEESSLRDVVMERVREKTQLPFIRRAMVYFMIISIGLEMLALPYLPESEQIEGLWMVFIAASVLACSILYALNQKKLSALVESECSKEFEVEWSRKRNDLERHHQALLDQHIQERELARKAWSEAEVKRIQYVEKAINGDLSILMEIIKSSFADLDLPFAGKLDFAFPDAQSCFINMDLPEIEDTIPENWYKLLKDGSLKSTKMSVSERNDSYAKMVCGVGVMVAATVFAAAPTMKTVHIAAYTQRKQSRGDIKDDYVYVSILSRESLMTFNPDEDDPVQFLRRREGLIEQQANNLLKKIPEKTMPGWVNDLRVVELK